VLIQREHNEKLLLSSEKNTTEAAAAALLDVVLWGVMSDDVQPFF
jgi:hypothetical protein